MHVRTCGNEEIRAPRPKGAAKRAASWRRPRNLAGCKRGVASRGPQGVFSKDVRVRRTRVSICVSYTILRATRPTNTKPQARRRRAPRPPGDSYPRRESRVRDRLDSRETRALAEEPAAGDARTARATPHARTGGAKRERVQNNIAAGNNVNLDSHRHDTSNSKLTRARGVV